MDWCVTVSRDIHYRHGMVGAWCRCGRTTSGWRTAVRSISSSPPRSTRMRCNTSRLVIAFMFQIRISGVGMALLKATPTRTSSTERTTPSTLFGSSSKTSSGSLINSFRTHAPKCTTRSEVQCPSKKFRFVAHCFATATCVCTRTKRASDLAWSHRALRTTSHTTRRWAS